MTKGNSNRNDVTISLWALPLGMMGFGRYEKITEEEAIALENAGDPIDAPPGKSQLLYRSSNQSGSNIQVRIRYSRKNKVRHIQSLIVKNVL